MKKKNTIKKYQEFKEILDIHKFKRNQLFSVYFRQNNFDYTRIGILVSKRNGNSVTRNKIKRQVRSIIEDSTNYDTRKDLIIVISKNYDTNNFEENSILLKKLLNDILKEDN